MKNIDEVIETYNYKAILYLIPVVGTFLSIVYFASEGFVNIDKVVRHMLYGIFFTAGLWLGCMQIVKYFWHKYPWQHFPIKHLIWEIIVITSYTLVYSFMFYSISLRMRFIGGFEKGLIQEIFNTLLITYFITTLHEAVFFYRQWKYNFSKSVQLENQHLNAKFESLKTQISPHYLFNSLNNLISIVDDNPLAVEYINNMAGYFRFLLQSRQEELVKVEEEFTMLKKYIYLHKIRYGDILSISIDLNEAMKNHKIPPLTIQMLVENSLKHNIISKNKPLHIKIFNKEDKIIVENNLNPRKDVEGTGQGLQNISERYKYFTQNEVSVEQTENTFRVTVPIFL